MNSPTSGNLRARREETKRPPTPETSAIVKPVGEAHRGGEATTKLVPKTETKPVVKKKRPKNDDLFNSRH